MTLAFDLLTMNNRGFLLNMGNHPIMFWNLGSNDTRVIEWKPFSNLRCSWPYLWPIISERIGIFYTIRATTKFEGCGSNGTYKIKVYQQFDWKMGWYQKASSRDSLQWSISKQCGPNNQGRVISGLTSLSTTKVISGQSWLGTAISWLTAWWANHMAQDGNQKKRSLISFYLTILLYYTKFSSMLDP